MSMKRGKEEEKMMKMGPMFPRLHVNDTDKGGPKAPPRNKMALYEQLSIPSQRFTTPSSNPAPRPQEFANMFFSNKQPTQHQSEKQHSQISDSTAPPSAKVERRKKSDEDDFRVPTFLHPRPIQECGEYDHNNNTEKIATSIPSFFNRHSKFKKAKPNDVLEISTSQEQGKSHNKEESSKEVVNNNRVIKVVSTSVSVEKGEESNKQTDLSLRHGPRDAPASVFEENIAALEKRSKSNSARAFSSKDLRGYERDGGGSVCEDSVLESISRVDVTPDDVVGIIGPKHFWKARRAIVNQQRVFAVQVFELHRLIKVQKSIAASPHLLHEESPYVSKPKKDFPITKIAIKYPIKSIPNIPKQKAVEPKKPTQEKEVSAENIARRESSFASVQNCAPSSISSNGNARSPWAFNQSPHGHQWLIPVMSPSEGLVYKPYPGPGFVGPAPSSGGCGPVGSNPSTGDFLSPHHQYPLPAHHPYFPPYGMPIMNPPPFSGPDADDVSIQCPNLNDSHVPEEDVEVAVQVSDVSSSPVQDSGVEVRSVLQLFPTSPAVDDAAWSSQRPPRSGQQQVIKVVPHNARSATESAARIFQSIQEERKRYDKF
ncbi:hypothetical protein ABFS83_05G138500 [Erythranthe nasuta]